MLDCFAPTSEYHQSQINGCNHLIFFGVLERRQIATVASLPRDDGLRGGKFQRICRESYERRIGGTAELHSINASSASNLALQQADLMGAR